MQFRFTLFVKVHIRKDQYMSTKYKKNAIYSYYRDCTVQYILLAKGVFI